METGRERISLALFVSLAAKEKAKGEKKGGRSLPEEPGDKRIDESFELQTHSHIATYYKVMLAQKTYKSPHSESLVHHGHRLRPSTNMYIAMSGRTKM